MSTLVNLLAAAASAADSQFWLDVVVKATALLLAAVAVSAILRRSSAALRHRVWCLTFAALVLLPGLSAALPKWRLQILPRAAEEPAPATTVAEAPRATPSELPAENVKPQFEPAFYEPPAARAELAPEAIASPPTPVLPPTAVVDAQPPSETASAPWSPGLATIWLLGAGLAMAPLAIGLARMFVLRRQARPVEGAFWVDLLDEVRGRLGLARRVTLLETRRAVMPMTWGLLRPAVLLPSQARDWNERLRRIVLLHELAHVKRYDVGFQLLGRLTCALYWFHPLAWYALRRLRIERELACDDCVVHTGELASDYAAELLQIARTYRPVRLAAGVAMAQRSSLEHRIRALFDRACSHLPVSARAARLLLVVSAIGVTSVAAVQLAPRAAAEDDDQTATEDAKAAGDDLVTIAGRVLDPQGHPAADAKVFAVRWYSEPHIPHAALAETTSGADGRFTISFHKSQFNVDPDRPEQWKQAMIVATADGAGPGWVSWGDILPGVEPTLTLAADAPITGRIVDLEGEPVEGVTVRVGSICVGKDGSLDGWLAAVRNGELRWTAARHFEDDELPQFDAWPPQAVTGSDGRFRIDGIGRERKVELSFAGPTIAYQRAAVVTRNSEPLQLKISTMSDESTPVYGADFELVAPPTQAIVGVVRDAATREPLAGVNIESNRFAGSNYILERHLLAVSDAQGRYRLIGMPKGAGNQLLAVPNDEQPYLMRKVDVPEARGLEPVEVDIKLHRGIWISGRVTDRTTGEPLVAWLHYLPFVSNEYARQTPEFGTPPGSADGYENRYVSRPDGSFRLVGLPGRAIVGALCVSGHYRDGAGAESIEGMDEHGRFDTYPNPVFPGKKWPHAMKEIKPAADAESVVCDLALDPGGKITVNVLDREGKPVSGFETEGSGQSSFGSTSQRASFDVIKLGPDETRIVIIRQKDRQLGKVLRLRTTDATSGSVSVKLEPLSRITGRLTDAEGAPLSGATITAFVHPLTDFPTQLPSISTDDEGRFEYPDIPVGCGYDLDAQAAGVRAPGWFAEDVAIEPGETKDLGDVIFGSTVKSAKKPIAEPDAKSSSSASATTSGGKPQDAAGTETEMPDAGAERRQLHGRVVDEAGRPIAGARVRLLRIDTERITWADQGQVVATRKSEADGTFAIDFPLGKPFATREEFISSSNVILAEAENHVFDWQHVSPGEPEITLQLSAEDAPIEGRVLDLEGRPIAGVSVGVNEISGGAENLDQWVEHAKRNPASLDASMMARPISSRNPEQQPAVARYPGNKNLQPGLASLLPRATTDENGSFRLAGLGRDRLVRLELAGSGIAKTWLNIVTRDMPAVPYPDYDPRFRVQTCFGRRFSYTAEPEQPITGVIRDADSGRPLVGAEVRLNQYADSLLFVEGFLSAKTDEQGRYALEGVPKPHNRERSHRLRIVPGADQPYFRTEFQVAKRDGFEPVPGDVKLKRALWLRGRAIDTSTGRPIHGLVEYYPFRSNQAAADYANFDPGLHLMEGDGYATDEDGNYQIPVLPGRGLAAFIALQGDRYPAGDGVDKIADLRQQDGRDLNVYHLLSLDLATAFREVNPPSGAAEAVCDIELKSLDVARIKLVDGEGRPVAGAVAQRLAPHRIGRTQGGWPNDALPDAAAEIIGPRETSRTAMFLHRERKLAAALLLTPQNDPPETVVLRPAATLLGRIVDRENKPIAELGITVSVLPPPGAQPLPGWGRESVYSSHQFENATTDKNGAFRIEQVPPGVAFVIYARHGAEETTTRVVEPGETLDLGDVVLEEPKDAKTAQAKAPAKPEPAAVAPAGEAEAAETEAPESSPKDAGSVTTLRGRVLDPNGKPLSGAKVYFWPPGDEMSKLEPKARTAADGGFEFTVDRSKLKWPNLKWINAEDPWLAARVVAAAEGYGYDWAQAAEPGPDGLYTIRLANDVPIRGRILSLKGQPVAKAKLTISRVELFRENRLDEYITAWKTGRVPFSADRVGLPPPGQPDSVETDAEGRFDFRGVGAERVANILLEGEGLASVRLYVMTRQSDAVVPPESVRPRLRPDRTHGATFTYLADPSRLIRGVVRERGTKTPIAGVQVRARSAAPISAKTDEAGRFELHGYPKAEKYFLDAAGHGSPYFSASLTVADQPGFDPIDVEFEMARGIEVSGRVTTARAGKPNSAYVEYCPLYRNPYTDRVGPDFTKPCSSAQCDADGRYTIPVLPGPGILTFQIANISKGNFGWDSQTYARAWLSRQEIIDFYNSTGVKPPEDGIFDNSVPISMGGQAFIAIDPSSYNEIALINPADGVISLTRDIELPLGGTLEVKLVDPDGKPVTEAIARGVTNSAFKIEELKGAEFTLVGLSLRIERQLIVEAKERKLAAYKVIRGEQQGPLTLRLEPCGAVAGRLLDSAGEPLAKTRLGLGRQWYSPADFAPMTDREGKFRVEGLVPGMPYGISLRSPDGVHHDRPMQDIVVAPGETKDVGDVRLQGPGLVAPPAAARPADDSKKRVRGQVVGSDQQPVKGAQVWLSKPFYDKWTSVAETDAQGVFQFAFETSTLRDALAKDSKLAIRLAATAEGLGFAWTDVGNLNAERGELPAATLRLVEDLPMEGRILTEDGQPAVGVTAYVLHVRQPTQPTLDEYVRAARKDGAGFHTFHDNTWDGNIPGSAAAVTDADGRFRMTGVGVERLVLLSLKGTAIHNWWIVVATRRVPDDEPDRKASGALHLVAAPYDNHYYAHFTHVSEPARTLQGVVRDRETKAPVAGVEVKADFNTSVVATTGADGRFELAGCRKASRYPLKAKAIAGGYFLREVSIADTPGIQPLDCELEMVKGVTARGRVTDRETGQRVAGTVDYYPLFPNPFTSRLGDIAIPCSTSPIDKDGAYELEVLPGPGVIVVRNYDKKYAPARIDLKRIKEILEGVEPWAFGNDEETLATAVGGQALGIIMRAQFKALAPIKPDDGAASVDQDLALVPGRTIVGVVLGPDGRPIEGVLACGTRAEFGPVYAAYEKLAGAAFAVECVTPDEVRTVLFYHPEQKLGARLEITAGHEGTLEVRLQACATVTGRLLDAGGKPMREATVVVTHKTSRVHIEEARTWTANTDGDGVFRVEGLIPGVEYSVTANGKPISSVKLAPGEVRDLGGIKFD